MNMRDDNCLPDPIRQAIIDRFEAWELVELLDINIIDILDTFDEVIADNLEDIKEELGMIDEQNEEE